jgi:hypothetical protein
LIAFSVARRFQIYRRNCVKAAKALNLAGLPTLLDLTDEVIE